MLMAGIEFFFSILSEVIPRTKLEPSVIGRGLDFVAKPRDMLHFCQRHNGPESWVHIAGSYTNLDKNSISESRLSINFKISTKHQYRE